MPSVARASPGRDRLAILAALEALEVGDSGLSVEILLAALEDGEHVERVRCRFCGAGFPWPGLRDRHELAAHSLDEEAARAA